jgi:uncharacterized ubiquitin-like protein YukD
MLLSPQSASQKAVDVKRMQSKESIEQLTQQQTEETLDVSVNQAQQKNAPQESRGTIKIKTKEEVLAGIKATLA